MAATAVDPPPATGTDMIKTTTVVAPPAMDAMCSACAVSEFEVSDNKSMASLSQIKCTAHGAICSRRARREVLASQAGRDSLRRAGHSRAGADLEVRCGTSRAHGLCNRRAHTRVHGLSCRRGRASARGRSSISNQESTLYKTAQ
jgi:hypothetical protein